MVFAVVAVAVAVDVAAVDEEVEDKNDCCKVDDDDDEVGCDLRVKLCDEVQFDGMLRIKRLKNICVSEEHSFRLFLTKYENTKNSKTVKQSFNILWKGFTAPIRGIQCSIPIGLHNNSL